MLLFEMPFHEYRIATYFLAFALGWFCVYLLVPVVRKIAIRLDFVDKPGGRKTQAKPISLGGGIAVFGGAFAAIIFAFFFADWSTSNNLFSENDPRAFAGLALACTATLILGVYDDATNMRGRYKLLGQLVVAWFLASLGFSFDRFELFGFSFEHGWITWMVSIFWLVGATNAINLLDGIDGLASSLGMVLCLTFAAINGIHEQFPEAVVMLGLAGGLLGFLRYNFAPASIYLGDAGSMIIGLLIGAISVQTHTKTPALAALTIPMAVWAIPILDSAAAILRRRLTGRSIFTPDRGHLHHSLLTRGWTVRQASTFIALVCATTCLSAVLAVLWQNEWIVIGTVIAVIIFLVSTKTFGHIEFALLRDRINQHGLSLRKDDTHTNLPRHGAVRLQGSHEWERMWESLVESANDYGLTRLKLTIHMPAVHEAFYANWKAPKSVTSASEHVWKTTLPLTLDGESVGVLDVAGLADDEQRSSASQIVQVLEFFEPLEDDIRRVRDQLKAQAAAKKQQAAPKKVSEEEPAVMTTDAVPGA